jgi:uncharacterized protein
MRHFYLKTHTVAHRLERVRTRKRLTLCAAAPTIPRAVSSTLPESVDPWRMVNARRSFSGRLKLSSLKRLATSLAASDGDVDYELDFGKDEFGISGVHVRATIELPLTCQRSLATFRLPVSIDTRLGFIVNEDDEAGLPEGYEPLLLDSAAGLRPADVIEDELILAVPIVPVAPGTQEMHHEWKDERAEEPVAKPNPFAVLQQVKLQATSKQAKSKKLK